MLLSIFGIIVGWFVVGFVINLIFYHDTPDEYLGKNEAAKGVHIIVNIITVILLLKTIFS